MSSAIIICNMALSNIGQDQTIASLTESSKSARLCKLWYEQCRDEVLQDFPWPFCTKAAALALMPGTPPPGWGFAYAYPTDCLQAARVTTPDGIRYLSNLLWWPASMWSQQTTILPQVRWPFKIMAGPDDANPLIIVTDLPQAMLYYIKRVTNPEAFSPMFVKALSWKLAAALALPMTSNSKVAQDAETAYIAMRDKAAAQALNEAKQDPEPESPSIVARYG